ncbi:flavin reductase family protein [Branchiibius cervicis]|uniref:Flavin reductase family protein n=1 Tax=Branchiibius cervicis TaxID=908252 RepID=A0ABW2AVM2_9MICO
MVHGQPHPAGYRLGVDDQRRGVANLAPHSFTTVAGVDPPTLCFVSVGAKDTLANVRATGEFVLQIGSWSQLAQMNDSATPLPIDEDEFASAQIATAPSSAVRPPGSPTRRSRSSAAPAGST